MSNAQSLKSSQFSSFRRKSEWFSRRAFRRAGGCCAARARPCSVQGVRPASPPARGCELRARSTLRWPADERFASLRRRRTFGVLRRAARSGACSSGRHSPWESLLILRRATPPAPAPSQQSIIAAQGRVPRCGVSSGVRGKRRAMAWCAGVRHGEGSEGERAAPAQPSERVAVRRRSPFTSRRRAPSQVGMEAMVPGRRALRTTSVRRAAVRAWRHTRASRRQAPAAAGTNCKL